MAKLSLQTLGRKIIEKRGNRGIRDVAQEIGVSPSTLSRIERGNLPDLETFGKICKWLEVNPADILGIKTSQASQPQALVHFRKEHTVTPETAKALADMILSAQRAFVFSEGNDDDVWSDNDEQ